jgi:hypothetical protein
MSTSPLRKIVFIQKVALFAGSTPKKALQLVYVTPEWRETVLDFTFDALFFEPFVKPLLQQTPSTISTEKEKEVQQQNEQKKLELFQQFRKVVSFVFQRVSAQNEELVVKMKTFLAVLFDFVHRRKNKNENNNYNDGDTNYAPNAAYPQEVASFLRADSLRSFLRIDDIHDLIINHIAPRVTAIEEFGKLICSIVRDEKSAELFANVESFSTILKCFHRSKTSADANEISSSINNILHHNPSSNKLLNSLPVVEAFSFIIPLAKDAAAVRWMSNALMKILENNEEAQQKFATPEFLKIFKGMEKHATTDSSKKSFQQVLGFIDPFDYSKPLADATASSQLKSAVDALPRHEKYYTEHVRDLLIAKKDLIVDAETADSVVKFLFSFSEDASFRPLFQTKEVRDLTINHIAPNVTAIEKFGGLIRSIVQDHQSAVLFSNVESFSAILKCFHRSKTSNDAHWIASCINNILEHNPSSNKLLNSLPVVEAFSFIIPLAKDDGAVFWIAEALQKKHYRNLQRQNSWKFSTACFGTQMRRKRRSNSSQMLSSRSFFRTIAEATSSELKIASRKCFLKNIV